MQKVLVTGATGFIGSQLAMALANDGCRVVALYRDETKTACLHHFNIELLQGDLSDKTFLADAMRGCDGFFHTAACAKLWVADKTEYYRTNVDGTRNVIIAALKAKLKRGVFTSSAGVLGPSHHGVPVTEEQRRHVPYFNEYERTKAMADELVRSLPVAVLQWAVVYPTRVYGPGAMDQSNGVTRMVQQYLRGEWHTIPGNGRSIGNYVSVGDVVRGHILAYTHGKAGESYLLGGDNLSYNDFFAQVEQLSGARFRLMKVPAPVVSMAAALMQGASAITGRAPLLTPDLARKFLYNWNTSCNKAKAGLGYRPVAFAQGMQRTIEWLRTAHQA